MFGICSEFAMIFTGGAIESLSIAPPVENIALALILYNLFNISEIRDLNSSST